MASMLRPGIQRWLQQHCDSSDAVSGGVVILSGSGHGLPDTVAEWPANGNLTPALASAAQAAVQRARPVVVAPTVALPDSKHNRVISMPLRAGDRLLGAVALAVRADDTGAVEALFKELALASVNVGSSLSGDDNPAHAGQAAPTARVLRLQNVLLDQPTLAEGAMAMVTELASLTGSERVSLGAMNPAMEVVAVSHSAEFKREQTLLRLASAAMQEAADQGARVSYPALATDPARIILAHADLHARTGHALLTLPLVHAGKAVGALLVEYRAGTTPDAEQIALCESVAGAIGSLVSLRESAERSWPARLAQSARAVWQHLVRRDDPLPKVAVLVMIGLLLAATLIPIPYRVGAPARIEGAVQRIIAAPFDGFLQRSHVRPGDTVHAGDLLVEMADQDLALEQRKWQSTLTQQENAYAAALAKSDRAQFVISQGKAEEARSQLELVRQQLSRTRLVAPIDGVVIKGDLSQTLGSPVQRGDALLTIAPREQYRLIVEVDERDIADVKRGQSGHLALSSLPSDTLPLVVERVTPVSNVRDGRNVFDVEARLPSTKLELRPGLQGVAKIDAGKQSFAWIWTHRAVDWLRMAWWTWGP
jgi:multidrug efflux pump subunit AcrA (membrane-fusion protein)